jgi:hypothetical protein
MRESLRALLSGVIDYAGLFPPTKLPLDVALRHYARYRGEPEAWMLGRFVIPATRLPELDALSDVLAPGPPFVFSVLGRGGDTFETWTEGLRADWEAVRVFRDRHGDRVLVDAFETKVPPGALEDPGPDVFRAPTKLMSLSGMSVVYEVPLGPDWELTVPGTLARLAGGSAGVKLRTGGLEASAFPTPSQVATVIETCRLHRLPLKCTAGLHHPLFHYDEGVKANMHGFLNVTLACVLAYTHGLVRNELVSLLEQTTLDRFFFEPDGFRYYDCHVPLVQLAAVRQEAFLSFGSCSFDEPRDDLKALGLL